MTGADPQHRARATPTAAKGTYSQDVTVSSDGGDGGNQNLVGSSVNNGSTWTAVVTDTSGAALAGTWDLGGGTWAGGTCEGNVYELSGIPKRTGSATFTSSTGTPVTVAKP